MIQSSSNILHETPDAIAYRLMQKAHNQDGLPEIAIGIFFLALAGVCWLQTAARPGSPVYLAAICGEALLIPTLGLSLPWAIKTVRRKFLIEREGYVESKPANRNRYGIVAGVALLVAVAGVFAAFRGSFSPASWVLGATGIGGGVLAAIAGRLPRFIFGGVVMAATGAVLAFSTVTLATGFSILYGLMGALSLLSGCVVFLLFMRQPTESGD